MPEQYYTKSRELIAQSDYPYPIDRGTKEKHAMPVFFRKTQTEIIYFAIPEKVLKEEQWQVIVVFGDAHEAVAGIYPHGMISSFDFPERSLVDNPNPIKRDIVIDPVVEYVIKTRNKKQPQITLFMRPPIGMTDISKANGVLAMCLLAGSVEEIKRRLQELDVKDEVGGILRFAEKHKLIIICWGARSLWNPHANWDEQSKKINKHMDETFDDVAEAWAKGIKKLSKKYGIPDKEFLLWGVSGSAQYAARLALRQPQFFLAIHVHIPSSFDNPTPEANQVLWCLTTGEKELGYERSLRFFAACRELGYPIIYKAIIGLGHSGHPTAEKLGLDFFEYALSIRDEKQIFKGGMDKNGGLNKSQRKNILPWPASFRHPEFFGDIINQEIFSFKKVDMIPGYFRTALPTKKLAETWNR